MKQQDKKEKFQVGDTVWVKGGFLGTVARITPFTVWVKPEDVVGVSHCQIVPTIDRRPTLRQRISLWWHGLTENSKTGVVLTAVSVAIFITYLITLFITR